MFNKLFKDHTTYEKVVKWFNANKYASKIQGLDLIDYPINKVINIQVTGGKIWAIAIVDNKVSYFIIEDEVIEDDKLDELINFKLIKNMNKSNILKNIDMNMKGLDKMKKLYNETVKNNNIEEVEEVTNEHKALQMIKNETVKDSVKYEVIEWIESRVEDYNNMEDIFKDLFTGGCQSGIVTGLIYYDDTLNFYNKYENEIKIFLEEYLEIEDVETLEGIQELVRYFPDLDDEDVRIFDGQDKIIDKAMDDLKDDYNLDDFNSEEIEQMEDDYIRSESEATNLFELNDQDKNMLAWASFEHEASLLHDEYLDVLNGLYMEEL